MPNTQKISMISLRASLWGELCAEGGCALGQGVVKNPDSETGAGYCAAWHRFHARALLYESKDLSADVCVWRGFGLLWDGGAEELDGLGTTLRILVGEFRRLVKLQVEAALRMNHHPHHQQQQTSVSMRENSCSVGRGRTCSTCRGRWKSSRHRPPPSHHRPSSALGMAGRRPGHAADAAPTPHHPIPATKRGWGKVREEAGVCA